MFVHPVTVRLARTGAGLLRDLEGQATRDLSNSDLAFHTLREYVPGDDHRHIHQRTSARMGTWMIRQFVDTRRSHLVLAVDADTGQYRDEDEFELAISVACSIGLRALADGQDISVAAGPQHVSASTPVMLLDGAAGLEIGGEADGLAAAAQATAHLRDVTVAVMVTGSGSDISHIRAAAARFSPDVATIVVRCDRNASPGVASVAGVRVMTVPRLDVLAGVVLAASA